MKSSFKLVFLWALLGIAGLACQSSKFGGHKKTSESKDSDEEVATVVCVEGTDDCAALTCEEIFALEAEGKINDDNRESMEDALNACDANRNRGSSDDQEAVHGDDETKGSADSSSDDSDAEDCD